MYSQSILSEIKKRLTLSEVIGKTVQLRKHGHEYHGLCPFHQEKTPSFTVNNSKEFYHCFGCGQHGSIFDFLMHQHHFSFKEAVIHAAEIAGVTLPVLKGPSQQEEKLHQSLLKILEAACQFFEQQLFLNPHAEKLRYLTHERKLTHDTIKKFRLGFAPEDKDALKEYLLAHKFSFDEIKLAGLLSRWDDGSWHDKFRNRIIYPILNSKGMVIAFGGRLQGTGTPKYLNSPETPVFQKSYTLYNWKNAQNSLHKKDPLVVVEGYMDAISLTQNGYERVVAPLGTAITEDQIQSLWKLWPEPILCFDGDEAGQRAASRAAERALPFLKPGKSLSFITLSPNDDPDTFIHNKGLIEWRNLLSKPQPLMNILWEKEVQQFPRKTPEERALLEKTLEDLCNLIQDQKIKTYYKREFKDRLFRWNIPRKKGNSLEKMPPPKKINALQTQERILLASILLHPSLWETISEEFMLIHFQTSSHKELQKIMETYFLEGHPLEKDTLKNYLIQCGQEINLQTVLCTDLLMHAPFLKLPNIGTVLKAWHEIRHSHSQRLWEKEELMQAKEQLSATLSPADWERYKRLKESLVVKEDEKEKQV